MSATREWAVNPRGTPVASAHVMLTGPLLAALVRLPRLERETEPVLPTLTDFPLKCGYFYEFNRSDLISYYFNYRVTESRSIFCCLNSKIQI